MLAEALQLVLAELEASIPYEHDNLTLRSRELGPDRRRQCIPHRGIAACGKYFVALAPEDLVQPADASTGIADHDRIFRHLGVKPADHFIGRQAVQPLRRRAGLAVQVGFLHRLGDARRPTVLVGFGVGAAGVQACVASWLDRTQLPFVSSWGGLGYVDHDLPGYCGQIGVYGNRGANFIVQNCDRLLVLGSRLDNRQRSGNPANFARGARVHVLDVDPEELRKLGNGQYSGNCVDLARLPAVLDQVDAPPLEPEWRSYVESMKESYLNRETSSSAQRLNSLSPYEVIRWFNAEMAEDAVVIGDTDACVCCLHHVFRL